MGGVIDSTLGTDFTGAKKGARRAMEGQVGAAKDAAQLQKEMYDQNRKDQAPWREAGVGAIGQLTEQMGDFQKNFSMSDFQQDPGYQFRMQEGSKALERSAAARGGLTSGGTLKALTQYGQNFGSNEYQNAYNRFNNDRDSRFNKLSSLAGVGQVANNQLGQAGQNYATNAGNSMMGGANARAGYAQGQLQQQNQQASNLIGAGMAFSDQRLKENITEVSRLELAELRATIKPYLFSYKDDEHGKGDWVGVMAQDLEKSKLGKTLVSEDENGFKQVNMQKVLSLMLATLSEGVA